MQVLAESGCTLPAAQDPMQGSADRDRNDILQRAGARMQEVVKKLADEKGLDLVVDSANTLFFKPALELTTDAVTAYNILRSRGVPLGKRDYEGRLRTSSF